MQIVRRRPGKRNHASLLIMYVIIAVFVYSRFQQQAYDKEEETTEHTIHKIDPDFQAKKEQLLSLLLLNDREGAINQASAPSDKEVSDNHSYYAPESSHAHELLDNRLGIEIAASTTHGFGLSSINIDMYDEAFQTQQIQLTKVYRRIDVFYASTIETTTTTTTTTTTETTPIIPLPDQSVEFVISNHVLQQVFDPIGTLCEWGRVIQEDGYIYMILPNKEHAFWHKDKPSTTLKELIARHKQQQQQENDNHHGGDLTIWAEHDVLEFLWYMGVKIVESSATTTEMIDGGGVDGMTFVIRVQRQNGMFSSRCGKQ